MLILIKSQNQVELQTFCRTTGASPTPWENPSVPMLTPLQESDNANKVMWTWLGSPKKWFWNSTWVLKIKGNSSDFKWLHLDVGFWKKVHEKLIWRKTFRIHINSHQFTSIHINSHQFTSIHINSHQFTSVHISSHQFTSIHNNSHVFTSIHINSHQFTSIHINSHQFTSVHINSHQFTSVHINSHVFTSIHINSHQFTSIHINSHQFTSVHINSHVFTSIHINSHQFTSIHINSHQFTSVHINSHQFTSIHINSHQFTSIHINSHQFTSIHYFSGHCVWGEPKKKNHCTEFGQAACTRRRSPIASTRDRRNWRFLDAQRAQWSRKCRRNNKKSQWNVEVCPKGDDMRWLDMMICSYIMQYHAWFNMI